MTSRDLSLEAPLGTLDALVNVGVDAAELVLAPFWNLAIPLRDSRG